MYVYWVDGGGREECRRQGEDEGEDEDGVVGKAARKGFAPPRFACLLHRPSRPSWSEHLGPER